MRAPDVIVIGGGLHGCSAALHLARRGARVIVIEKDHVGRHASGANAGGVRRLGRHLAELPLCVAAMEMWHRINELVDDDCGFESHGQIKVAENDADLEFLRHRAADVARLGFSHEELIDRGELKRIAPAISDHCVGALLCRGDGAANPYRTTLAFKHAAERLGVVFLEGVLATTPTRSGAAWRIETDVGRLEAPMVVNCAGAWADRIAAALDEPVPLEPVALMLMITAPLPPFLKPVLGATSRPLSFKQLPNGTVLIGGGHQGRLDRNANMTELDFVKLATSARTALELFPIMRQATLVRCWAGIEARMPDEIPVIGASSTSPAFFHAFGFSGHGFQLGPIVGAIIAELATSGRTNLPIQPFRIERFARRSSAGESGSAPTRADR